MRTGFMFPFCQLSRGCYQPKTTLCFYFLHLEFAGPCWCVNSNSKFLGGSTCWYRFSEETFFFHSAFLKRHILVMFFGLFCLCVCMCIFLLRILLFQTLTVCVGALNSSLSCRKNLLSISPYNW